MSKTIRDAVLSSFERIGAEEYLIRQSAENPVAYMSLLGKILPTQVTGADGNALVVEVVTGIFRSHEPGED